MSAEVKTYNGWTNYETWNVALWMGNDEVSERRCRSMAESAWEERATLDLSEAFKSMVETDAPDLGTSMYSDLLSAALSEVDWHEIAGHYIEDVDKNSEEDEGDES